MISNRLNMPPSSSSVASKCQLTHWAHSLAYTKIMHHPLYAYYFIQSFYYWLLHVLYYFSIYALIFSNIICGCLSMWLYFKACIHIGFDIAITKFRFYFVMILVSISIIFVICIFDVWTFGWFLIQLNDEYAMGVWWQVNQTKYRW